LAPRPSQPIPLRSSRRFHGRPKTGDQRWAVTVGPLQEFSLSAYLKAWFTANPGYYRVLAFIVSATPFSQSETTVSRDEAMRWLARGLNVLPPAVAAQPMTPAHRATVHVLDGDGRWQIQASSAFRNCPVADLG
jgi:hypothetical protein